MRLMAFAGGCTSASASEQPGFVVAETGVDLPGVDLLAEVSGHAAQGAQHRVVLVVVAVHAVSPDRVQRWVIRAQALTQEKDQVR